MKLIKVKNFGEWLKVSRTMSGMTGERFAASLGISRQFLYDLMSGKAQPNDRILAALGLNPGDVKSPKRKR